MTGKVETEILNHKGGEQRMKKVINGKVYNTATAEELHSDSYSHPGDFQYWRETLYVTPKGAYFIHGEGGASSKYGQQVEQNTWSGGADITPVSKEEAIRWLEEHDGADVILERFAGDVEEA